VINEIFFAVFAAVILSSSIMVIAVKNAIHSAIFLIITLLGVAGIFLLLGAEFLAGVQAILYVGGIMVLFLFVIMLVNLDEAAKERSFNRHWAIGLGTVVLLGLELTYMVSKGSKVFDFPSSPVTQVAGNTEQVGDLLYKGYMLPFEIASILLLVAMVGAVVLAKKRI
jgi:NADH-quinone oxidoreductase subunit J